jgi:hypothetical protein
MHPNQLILLEYLEPYATFEKVDITSLIDRLYPKIIPFLKQEAVNKSLQFLSTLKSDGYIDFDENDLNELSRNSDQFIRLYNEYKLLASITDKGIEALHKERERRITQLINQSAIDTNNSIIATNLSVQATNDKMVENSKEQVKINKTLADNSGVQTEILSKQTHIFYYTCVFAFGSLLIAFISLYVSIRKDTSAQLLEQKSQVIHTLQNHISRLKTDSSLASKAKKTESVKK